MIFVSVRVTVSTEGAWAVFVAISPVLHPDSNAEDIAIDTNANLYLVKDGPEDKRRRVAEEVFNVYAPLAHRLGIGHLKWELEDLAFRYLQPDSYKKIAKLLDEKRLARQDYINEVVQRLREEIHGVGIKCDVYGRAKHIYSIWRKMNRKNLDFSQIYDIRAVRILVPEVRDCYAVLGIVHSQWRHIPNEFDDYIANPKENGYRSLHTAVIGPEGKVLEVQIRTDSMHEDAELGVCAHWLYKGTDLNAKDQGYEQKIAWLRQVLEWHEELDDLPERLQALADVLGRRPVYLHSGLESGIVEELGLGYIATPDEVLRVARPFEQGLLIRDAHRCRPPIPLGDSRAT